MAKKMHLPNKLNDNNDNEVLKFVSSDKNTHYRTKVW